MSDGHNERIFLSAPDQRGNEEEYVLQSLRSGWLAPAGPELGALENEIADLVASGPNSSVGEEFHVVALSSGTAALHLALLVSGVGPGDEVLCPTLTFAATANAIVYTGAAPVFVDSEASTWGLDPELVERELATRAKVGKLPKAVIAVDLYGQCCRYEPLIEVCQRFEVPLIEDAAEALGATYQARPAGAFGDASIFSFNGNKIITGSGGGVLVSRDEAFADRARHLSTQARQPVAHYEHTEIGYNYRMPSVVAALVRAQLATLDDRVDRRRMFNQRYREELGAVDGIDFMPEAEACFSTFWLSCITIDPQRAGLDREQLRLRLEESNIEARAVWKPMHLQPVYSDARSSLTGVADDLFETGLCLPSGSGMTDDDFNRVAEALQQALQRTR